MGVATPVSIVAFCYGNVYWTVAKNKKKVAAWKQSNTANSRKANERVHSMRLARTLFIIFIVFIISWSPFTLLITFDFAETLPMQAYIFSVILAHTNSSMNCIIYGTTNQDFRRGYLKFLQTLIPKRCRVEHEDNSEMTYMTKVVGTLQKEHSNMKTKSEMT